jgi:Lar family restriction alleviation protein
VTRRKPRKPSRRKPKRRRSSWEAMLAQPVTLGGEPLAPCPFCGEATRLRAVREGRFSVECRRCGARGPTPPADRIISAQHAWNTRTAT